MQDFVHPQYDLLAKQNMRTQGGSQLIPMYPCHMRIRDPETSGPSMPPMALGSKQIVCSDSVPYKIQNATYCGTHPAPVGRRPIPVLIEIHEFRLRLVQKFCPFTKLMVEAPETKNRPPR